MTYRPTSKKPLNKVSAAAVAGAVVILLVWGLRQFAGIDVPVVAQNAAIVLVSFVVAYQTPIKDGEIARA